MYCAFEAILILSRFVSLEQQCRAGDLGCPVGHATPPAAYGDLQLLLFMRLIAPAAVHAVPGITGV